MCSEGFLLGDFLCVGFCLGSVPHGRSFSRKFMCSGKSNIPNQKVRVVLCENALFDGFIRIPDHEDHGVLLKTAHFICLALF